MNRSQYWRVCYTTLMGYVILHTGSSAADCFPCLCNATSRSMECSDVSYIVRPPNNVQSVIIRRVDFGSFGQSGLKCLGNLTGVNLSELTLTGCKLISINPRKLFSGLKNLQVLRLNRTIIIPEDLRIAFYSLCTTKIRKLYLDDLDHAPLPGQFFDGLKSSKVTFISLRGNSIRNLRFSDHADVFQGVPGLQTLILSENQITGIKNRTFAGLRNLQHLYLDFNKIRRLETAAFHIPSLFTLSIANNAFEFSTLGKTDKVFSHLNKLKVLNISGNLLRGVSPENLILLFRNLSEVNVLKLGHTGLKILPDGIFAGMENLKEIYLEENQIKTWNPDAFSQLVHLEVLYLNKNKIQVVSREQLYAVVNKTQQIQLNLANNPFSCTCSLLGFLEWLNSSQRKPVGYPDLYTCVSPFEFYQKSLSQIIINKTQCVLPVVNTQETPEKMSSCYPCNCTPKTLSCSGPSLPYIPVPPSSVNEVLLQEMQFEFLNQRTFKNLTHIALSQLSLTNCTIHSQANDTFSQLSGLEELNLYGTPEAPKSLMHGLRSLGPNITFLYLENMKLKSLPSNMFQHFKSSNLTTLSLSRNLLESIPSDGSLFSAMANLKYLDLSNNFLQNLTNQIFQGLSSLRHLNLGYNRISSIETFSFNSESITHLWLNGNRYRFSQTNVDNMFQNVTKLQTLDISDNDLSQLKSSRIRNLFAHLEDLQILTLRNTGLNSLPAGLTLNKPDLRVLDVSNNGITNLTTQFLANSNRVRTLSLSGNKIQNIPKYALQAVSKSGLRQLNLGKNPFSCSCDLAEFLHWINTTRVNLIDYPEHYICASPSDEVGKRVSEFQIPDACQEQHPVRNSGILVVSILSAVAGALLLTFVLVVYFNRREIWFAAVRFKARLQSERIDKFID